MLRVIQFDAFHDAGKFCQFMCEPFPLRHREGKGERSDDHPRWNSNVIEAGYIGHAGYADSTQYWKNALKRATGRRVSHGAPKIDGSRRICGNPARFSGPYVLFKTN